MEILQPKSVEEIDKLLKTGEINQVEKYCYQIFKILDNIHYKLVSRQITSPEEVDKYLDKVTGYRGYLAPVFASILSYKKGEENGKYVNEMQATQKAGNKWTSAVGDKIASQYVQKPRTLRNQVEGYVKQADITVKTLITKLSYYKTVKNDGMEEQG